VPRPFVDRAGGPEQARLVAGSTRGGTTWLAEMLAAGGHTRVVFEPFNAQHVAAAAGVAPRPYVRRGSEADPSLEHMAQLFLGGRVRSPWTDRYCRPGIYRSRLVKDVRISLMFGWLVERHALRAVYVVRHPCAVTESRLRLGWKPVVANLLHDTGLVADHLEPFAAQLRDEDRLVERAALLWAAETYVALRARPASALCCAYEDLVSSPEGVLPALVEHFGTTTVDAALEQAAVRSWTARLAPSPGSDTSRVLSADERLRVIRAIAPFGLDELYGVDGPPRAAGRETWAVLTPTALDHTERT
jgi:hypothetical protein